MSNPERLFADAPFMGLFVDASLRSHEETGDCHISPEDRRVLMGVFGLEPGEQQHMPTLQKSEPGKLQKI